MAGQGKQNKQLLASGIPQLAGVPYKLLDDLDFLSYQEDTPTENARKLAEHEVDLALIPAVDFATHGGYMSLEFGMGTRRKTDSMILYANQRVSDLDTVHIYQCSSSSMVLLRLLLKEKWKISPRFVRRDEFEPFDDIKPNEGVLALHELPGMIRRDFRVAEDLGRAWFLHTGLPFVFLIWATRPGSLSAARLLQLHQVFHRSAKASKSIARQYACSYGTTPERSAEFVGDNRRYYLDYFLLEGLDEFLCRASSQDLIPRTPYQQVTASLLERRAAQRLEQRQSSRIIHSLVDGRRLGIEEGIRVASEASLAELVLAGEMIRLKRSKQRKICRVFTLEESSIEDQKELALRVKEVTQAGGEFVRIEMNPRSINTIFRYEALLRDLKKNSRLKVEAFEIQDLYRFGENHKLSVEEVLSRFARAGLHCISGAEGQMLLEKSAEEKYDGGISVQQWTDVMRAAHRFGLQSWCSMRISPQDTWEDRLVHLQKLRVMQDENPGFLYFCGRPINGVSPELYVRAMLVSRLFLDNLSSFHELLCPSHLVLNVLGLETASDTFQIRQAIDDRGGDAFFQEISEVLRELELPV